MKKVAIIADGWKRYINYAWVGGCREYIAKNQLDIDLYVFNSFGNFSKDEKYNIGEYNIVNLPDLSRFDGIIVELTNIAMPDVKANIIKKVLDSKVPAVSLVEELPGMGYTGIDNYKAMKAVVEHMITKHQCSKLNYIGGPKENGENRRRLDAYRDALKEHGIPFEESRVFMRDYEIETGELGLDHFVDRGNLPDAFICANDNIAVGVCHRAKEIGYEIPEDFCVTGFDDFDKASYYSPRISTVGFTREDIAYKAIELLEHIWKGEKDRKVMYAKSRLVFQDSCGCIPQNPPERGKYIIDHIFGEVQESQMLNELQSLKRQLLDCEEYAEMAQCLPKCLKGLRCQAMYIMMNRDVIHHGDYENHEFRKEKGYRTQGYPDDLQVVLAYENGHTVKNCQLLPGQLLPEKTAESDKISEKKLLEKQSRKKQNLEKQDSEKGVDMYLFSPLHFRDQEIGYIAMKNCDYMMDNQFLFEVLNAFLEALEYLHSKVELRKMNQELSLLYIMDSLTGLYNRMAYNRKAIPLYEQAILKKQPVMVMFVDVDRLKRINDNFGHDMGNIAIKTIATAIRECCPEESVAMRYGGDEFVVLIPDCDLRKAIGIETKIQRFVKETSEALQTGFEITASIGYTIADHSGMSLNDCINLADERMYNVKKEKHKSEKNKKAQ